MKLKTGVIWDAILNHPFVTGIGEGTLALDKYEFYLKQDYLYLIDFSRVFALTAAKARRLNNMAYFAKLLDLTLNTEMELHRSTCAGFGILKEELESTRPALVTLAYTSFLVKTCYEETLPGILAALLPCALGYVDIALFLREKGLPQVSHYRDWIETYASKEFVDYAHWLKRELDVFADEAPNYQKEHWSRLYLQSARFELLFFDMSWRKEMWPGVVPAIQK